MTDAVDETPNPALRAAARTPEFWRDQITRRLPPDPDVSGDELFATFLKVYRRRLADEIEQHALAGAADVVAALRAGEIGKLPEA